MGEGSLATGIRATPPALVHPNSWLLVLGLDAPTRAQQAHESRHLGGRFGLHDPSFIPEAIRDQAVMSDYLPRILS